MTAFDYSRSVATAKRLIARFGKAGAIRRTSYTDSAGTPWDTSDDVVNVTDHTVTLVVTDYALRERDNTLIGATDRRVLISTDGLAITPTSADLVVVDGAAHEIVRISPLQPGSTVILWEAQVTF